MLKFAVIAAIGSVFLSGCSQNEEADPAATKLLMAQKIQPKALVYWNAVQYISDEQGSREIKPRTDAEWNRVAEAAASLKKLARELKRPALAAGRGTDWQEFSDGLADVSAQAEQAAKTRNPQEVLEAGGTMYNVCSACHEVYMPSSSDLSPVVSGTNRPSH